MDITVVAPTYQRVDRLRRLVAGLEAQTLARDRFEVVLVDDASGDGTPAVLADLAARSPLQLRVLRRDENGGPAAARNTGWRTAAGEVVAFVDDDCTPEPGWLAGLERAFARNPRLGVVQGWTRAAEGPRGQWTIAREISDETPWFEGCNIAYRRVALEETGGFDEEIRWYGEDTSAGWKVLDAGFERDFEPGAVVTHDLEERGLRWRIRHGFLERNLVELALRHQGLRREAFWRPWSFRRTDAACALALVGLVAAARRPSAVALALPYAAMRARSGQPPAVLAGLVAIDVAQVAGHLAGSGRRGAVGL